MLVSLIHKQHLELRELFMRHQEALLQARFDEAMNWLSRFHTCLSAHMLMEEIHLFPEFAGIERETRWDVDLYEMEHGKIRQLYEILARDLAWLREQSLSDSDLRRNIITLLDKEKTFKGMLEHHEEREEDAMLKEMMEQLPDERINELVEVANAAWEEVIRATSN